MPKLQNVRKKIARLPIIFFKIGIDKIFGNRIAMITHIDRNSGEKRFTVLEVIRLNKSCTNYVFYSGWGYNSDWAKNITGEVLNVDAGAHIL